MGKPYSGDEVSTVAEESAAAAAPAPVAWPNPRYAWYVMAVIIVAYSFAILDRSIIGLIVAPMKADLQLTDAQIGLLQGLAFAICYTTFGLVVGYICDKTDRRALLALGIFIWSVGTIVCGFADSFEMLFISRIFVGLGEACALPVSSSLIADYMPPKSRAKAYGLFMLGGTLGTALGYQVGGRAVGIAEGVRAFAPAFIDNLHDWQIAFLVAGVPGIFVAAVLYLTVREPVRREKSASLDLTLKPMFDHMRLNWVPYTCLLTSTVLNVLCIYAQINWAPTFMIRVFKWTPEETSNFLLISSVIGATSAFSVGWMMAWLIGKGRGDAPMIACGIHGACSLLLGPIAYLAPSTTVMVIFYLSLSFTSNWSTSAALMGVSQITPNELRGKMVAFYTMLSGLVSLSLGAYLVGVLSDKVFPETTGIRFSLATVYAGSGALSCLLIVLGRPAFRASVQRALAWTERT